MNKKTLLMVIVCFLLSIVILPTTTAFANEDKKEDEYTYTDLSKTMYAKDSVNIRTLPHVNGSKLGVLHKNKTIEVTGRCNETGWYHVIYKDSEAYISGNYLKDIIKEEPKKETIYTYKNLDKTMYAKDSVNIRTLPCINGTKVGSLDKNESIKVTGRCNETGWYRVIYKDSEAYISGNYLKDEPVKEVKKEKVIYLTFDDGPTEHTPKLLEILDKYNVKATFFVVTYKGYNHLIKDIHEAGHAVGIHTASHWYKKIYANDDAYYNDLYKAQNAIYEQIGIKPTIIRFPGGSSNKVSIEFCEGIMTRLTKSVIKDGFQYFDWNVDSNDAGGAKTSEEVYNNIIKGIKKKDVSIVLQHDSHEFSINAVEDIIVWALENGYVFKTLDMNSPTAHHRVNN